MAAIKVPQMRFHQKHLDDKFMVIAEKLYGPLSSIENHGCDILYSQRDCEGAADVYSIRYFKEWLVTSKRKEGGFFFIRGAYL